jgi:molecular chaperone GrpE
MATDSDSNATDSDVVASKPEQQVEDQGSTIDEDTEGTEEGARLEELENSRTEVMNRLTRAKADLSNLKRRSEQETEEIRKFANQMFAADLLRIIDSLDRALSAIPENMRGFTWIDGLIIFRAQIDSLLKTQGIESVNALGEKFDPRFHEAVAQDGDSGLEGTIREVFQVGYTIHDRLLRPALVKVGPSDVEENSADADEPAVGDKGEGSADLDEGLAESQEN